MYAYCRSKFTRSFLLCRISFLCTVYIYVYAQKVFNNYCILKTLWLLKIKIRLWISIQNNLIHFCDWNCAVSRECKKILTCTQIRFNIKIWIHYYFFFIFYNNTDAAPYCYTYYIILVCVVLKQISIINNLTDELFA